jgi:hypothetical protein
MGAITGGISAGIAEGFGNFIPSVGNKYADFAIELASRSAIGGIAGGITAEIYGGKYGEGFTLGAATAAAGFLFNATVHRYILVNQSANRQVWIDTKTGKVVPAIGEYVDPLTDYMRDALSAGATIVDRSFDNPLSNELAKTPPSPTTGPVKLIYDAYFLVQGFYREYMQPYVQQFIRH